MNLLILAFILVLLVPSLPVGAEPAARVLSPDGNLAVEFSMSNDRPVYSILRGQTVVLETSRLGIVRDDADFSTGMKLIGQAGPTPVEDRYEILTAKRRVNTYRANRHVFHLESAVGGKMDVIFQVSNDGVGFRYHFPEQSEQIRTIKQEETSFHFPPGSKAWLQPMAVAKTGWAQTNPSYEEHYVKDAPVGQPSRFGAGWVYPALFRSGDTWVLISETGLGRNYCGTRLRHESPDGEYFVGLPDPREKLGDGAVHPQSTLPWTTPWRLIVVGDLATIAESTLGIDLADPPTEPADPQIRPGKASWSWALLGDDKTRFDVQKRFIDYAADMAWQYCLIDALWDTQIGYERTKELADYAATKNVGLLVWYNSAGNWNSAPQTPRDKMLTRQSRLAEFERLKSMGIKGLKIDFFGGDGQSFIGYYHDILQDAAPHGFLVNFHGCTLPRGWQRTYPHLMTMEAIRGFEFVTFDQRNGDEQPSHCAMLPFTRNVFDPMDFTPVCLDRVNDRIRRRTTAGFELALSVLFTSGIQHYVEIPEGMAKMPDFVKQFLKRVPGVWDDVHLIDGIPGKHVVLARQGGGKWYLAGINGEGTEKHLSLDLRRLPASGAGTLITDGGAERSFDSRAMQIGADKKLDITLKPNGGFVAVFD